ncbi:MAG: tRNA (guanosine(37)-N1)-methyltransferase TrmD [Holosporales bacterium]|nr:tRNA (guanosine(37)-N1)-methyltransferase TrmD [Holosporales bacterium]
MFSVTVVSIFPEIFPGPLAFGLSGKGLGRLWDLHLVNIRDFATDKHRKVDDSPFGGGAGMIMKPDVVHDALSYAVRLNPTKTGNPTILFMSPRGALFSQKMVRTWYNNEMDSLIILCGRYEGIDQRVIDFWKKNHGMIEVSVGDFVLFGGELPAMCIIDACLRQIPGIMHNELSTETESFSVDLLEYPQYTRPCEWNGERVPAVLLSGNHGEIGRWRLAQSEEATKELRRDLWERYERDVD